MAWLLQQERKQVVLMSVIPAITQSVGMARVSLESYPFPVYLGEHSELFRNYSIFLGMGLLILVHIFIMASFSKDRYFGC